MDEQSILERIKDKSYFHCDYGGASTSGYYQQTRNDLDTINRTFNNCRINNPNNNHTGKNTLLWNPETNCFELRQFYYPKFKEKYAYPKEQSYQKNLNVNNQVLQSAPLRNYPKRKQLNLLALNDKYKRDECFQKILDIKDQVIKSSSTWFKTNSKHTFVEPKYKTKFKKYKAVSFNPEVQVIYMINKRSNNEVHLKGVEVLNKEQDQQLRNYIMRSEYNKKKLLY